MKGKPGEWYADNEIGGYFDDKGDLVVCEEYGVSDADADRYAIDVMNGYGSYDESGKFVRYKI